MKSIFFIILLLGLFQPASAWTQPFKVGVIVALSGPAAANGIAMRNSIELAKSDSPENFTNIEFIFEDARYDSAQAVAAFHKLKEIDRVNLFYVWGVSFCSPTASIALKARVPVICQGIEQPSYINNPYVIRFMNSTDQYMKLLLSHIRKKGWRKIGIVITDNPYVEGLLEALERNIMSDEAVTVVDRYPTGELDMSSTVTKLRRSSFDVIGVLLTPGQIGQFYQQLAKQQITTPTFGANFFENFDEIRLGGKAMNGAVYVHNQVESSFVDRYQATFGNQSQLAFGGMAYEFASTVGGLFNIGGSQLSSEQVLEKFSLLTSQSGKAMGSYRFTRSANGDRYFDFLAAVKEVRDGSYRILKN